MVNKQAATQKRYEERLRRDGMVRKSVWVPRESARAFDEMIAAFRKKLVKQRPGEADYI